MGEIHAVSLSWNRLWCPSKLQLLLGWLILLFLKETPAVVLCWVWAAGFMERSTECLLFKIKRKSPCRAELPFLLLLKQPSLSFTLRNFLYWISLPSVPRCLLTTLQTLLRFSTHICFNPFCPPLSSLFFILHISSHPSCSSASNEPQHPLKSLLEEPQ